MKGSSRKVNPFVKSLKISKRSGTVSEISEEESCDEFCEVNKEDASTIPVEKSGGREYCNHEESEFILEYHRSILADATKKDIKIIRAKLLNNLPIYKTKHLKGESYPGEGVVADLDEQGFEESSAFLRSIFEFERKYRSAPDNVADSNNWPWLSSQTQLLNTIVSAIRDAELAKKKERKLVELGSWLRISVFMAQRKSCWYWLTDTLFKKALRVAKEFKQGEVREAFIRFTYGQFLTKKLKLHVEALRQFNMARKLSRGKNLEGIDLLELKEIDSDFHSQTCYYINKTCLIISSEIRDRNPYIAVKLAQKALGIIEIACRNRKTTGGAPLCPEQDAAVFELALSFMAAKEYNSAINKLNLYMARCKRFHDARGYCKALYLRAQCYQQRKQRRQAMKDLKLLCGVAVKCELQEMSTVAELEFSEILLSLNSKAPVENLKSAASGFLVCHDHVEREIRQRARCLIGVAEGQYLWPQFLKMIIKSGTDRTYLYKLLQWVSIRSPFFQNQIQSFTVQVPKRGVQHASGVGQQIQKFVLPDKFFEILGERLNSKVPYNVSTMVD